MDGRGDGRGASTLTAAALDTRRAYKPLDVGNGIVAGSVAANGRWLSLGIAHPKQGRVEVTSAPPFSGDPFSQRDVRAYRASLAAPGRASFGFDLLDGDADSVELLDDSFPRAVLERAEGLFEVTTFAPHGRAGAVQLVVVKARVAIGELTWGGQIRLARAEYTQLTPGGPLPPAPAERRARVDGVVFPLEAEGLGAAAIVQGGATRVDEGDRAIAVLALALAADRSSAIAEARALASEGPRLFDRCRQERRRVWRGLGLGDDRRAARAGIRYAIDCATSAVDEAVAVLADHQILPLVWTRDAYYVCRMLLAYGGPELVSIVEGFLRWMFERAERVNGWWPRASLASGAVKDPAFQLDQQLYPLLLIADHARLARNASVRARYRETCDATLGALLAKRTEFGLVATDETPADDPLAQPYHFSSHVLLWRVLDAFDHAAANEVRNATLRHFTSDGRFAYAIAGPEGAGARHYHDANDLPTVFAPGWGFCGADDPRWRATLAFAWSERNDAYFTGAFGGLGSLHTPHPWPLGDLQQIVVARVMRDAERERAALARLGAIETWDAMLPEAYDERTGAVASRHWFAWPVALRALLEREPALVAP